MAGKEHLRHWTIIVEGIHRMMSRGICLIAFFCMTATILLLSGCPQTTSTSVGHTDASKEKPMNIVSDTLEYIREIPPIDKTAPLEFETATFGLG